ncbi:MAG: hypothetical protein K9M99_12650 [Candidatus Cloacimonetes bacterium]|nr:hypothetical protein [Candidatus Cloacimonadota bacterium]
MLTDFEKSWRNKLLSRKDICENKKAAKTLRDETLAEPEFTKKLLDILTKEFTTSQIIDIMLGAACHYPERELEAIREEYSKTGDLKLAHSLLQVRFDAFMADILTGKPELQMEIKKRNWGLAGRLAGNKIIAAKIPKSGFLEQYFNEQDIEKKRLLYCHCPRIRAFIGKTDIDPLYCYCGAGFYQDIWEYITGKQVKVKLLKSIIKGDDHCQFELQITDNDIK